MIYSKQAQLRSFLFLATTTLLANAFANSAQAFFLDGKGHYGLRGETQTSPLMSKRTGLYQAIDQSFDLVGEARFNDKSSLFIDFKIFDNPRQALLGDTAQPTSCAEGEDSACASSYQNINFPGYAKYTPRITEVYAKYAFDYCILEAGRRPRDWGLGIFLSSGHKPFEYYQSVFDGATCYVNTQKAQNLSFAVGYDKLTETSTYVRAPQDGDPIINFGPTNKGDVDQYFFMIEHDDRKTNAGSPLTKQIGIYAANIRSGNVSSGGSSTNVTFLDLYTGLYFQSLALHNEILFRLGKSADPSIKRLGGATDDRGSPAVNNIQGIALAGNIEWTLTRSGSLIGPAYFKQGDANRHVLFLDYAYAPGDMNGYYTDTSDSESAISILNRKSKAEAFEFNPNYKPALILFNAHVDGDALRVDGIFNATRLINTKMLAFGYRYEDLKTGNFEARLVYATMDVGMPSNVHSYWKNLNSGSYPIGYNGSDLGYELDLKYTYSVTQEVDLGVATGLAIPGKAWQVSSSSKPSNAYVIQGSTAFHF